MGNDFIVEIAPANTQIRLTVRAKCLPGIPEAGKKLQRLPLNLATKEIDQLRSGSASPILVQGLCCKNAQRNTMGEKAPVLVGLKQLFQTGGR